MKALWLLSLSVPLVFAAQDAKSVEVESAERVARVISYTGSWQATPGDFPPEARNAPEVRYWKLLDKASEWIETQAKVSKDLLEVALFVERTYPGQSIGSSLLGPKKKDPRGWQAALAEMKAEEANILRTLAEGAEAEEHEGNNAP